MSSERRFLAMDMLFEGGRMFVGGISAAFLVTRGVPIAEIATIKGLQAMVVFLAEVPTGVLGDRLGRKVSLLLATLTSLCGFSLYLSATSLSMFLLGETCLALSLCFWSGSFEAWASSAVGVDHSPEQTRRFFHKNSAWTQSAVVVFGLLGGWLSGRENYQNAYGAALASQIALLALIVLTPEKFQLNRTGRKGRPSSWELFRETVQVAWSKKSVRLILALFIALQFLVQPILHYWQPLFLAMKPTLGGTGLGPIFAFSALGMALANFIFRHRARPAWQVLVWIWLGLYLVISTLNVFPVCLASFVLIQAIYSLLRTSYSSELIHRTPTELRASLLSVNAFVSRVGMLGGLALIHFELGNSNTLGLSAIQPIFAFFAVSGFIIFIGLFLFNAVKLKRTVRKQMELSCPKLN